MGFFSLVTNCYGTILVAHCTGRYLLLEFSNFLSIFVKEGILLQLLNLLLRQLGSHAETCNEINLSVRTKLSSKKIVRCAIAQSTTNLVLLENLQCWASEKYFVPPQPTSDNRSAFGQSHITAKFAASAQLCALKPGYQCMQLH